MSKPKNDEPKKELQSPQDQAKAYLEATKSEHYNFEKTQYYKTPSSSLILNLELGGEGIPPGAHRFVGINSGGKTSCSLDFLSLFLKQTARRGVYFKCEGRLYPEIQERSGVKFVSSADEWTDGTCLVFETNVYEVVFGFIRELIVNNPLGTNYFFIIDSVDNMILRDDMEKPLNDAGKVAGGALLTSVFLKKAGIALSKRGHICIFVSQVRDTVNTDKYKPDQPRQGKSSGGHAIEHNANLVMDFQNRHEADLIREGSEDETEKKENAKENVKAKIIGHWCKIKLIKTDNEKNGAMVRYPIKYGRTKGTSIWIEYEIVLMLLGLQLLNKKGSWLSFEPSFYKEIVAEDSTIIEKIQGSAQLRQYLEENPKISALLRDKIVKYQTMLK